MDRPRYDGSVSESPACDVITSIELRLVALPLRAPTSDAKVVMGRQKPLTEVAVLIARIATEEGYEGIGFSYSKRAGGEGLFAHACEVAPELLGADPSDIGRLWHKLVWAGASVGRSGVATQAIAAFDVALWDIKGKRARLPLAKLLGAHRDSVRCYDTSAGFLSTPLQGILDGAAELVEGGIGGLKIKIGQPDFAADLERLEALRELVGDDFPIMVDVNQQWSRLTARRFGSMLERFNLVWIEEPLDAYDVEGHAALVVALDTPIATGEMLTSALEHSRVIEASAAVVLQPDAPRVGGITPFLGIAAEADHHDLVLSPHFAMEIHLHLAAAYPGETWVEHFDWLHPLFHERATIRDGRMLLPTAPGLGVTLTDDVHELTVQVCSFGARPS